MVGNTVRFLGNPETLFYLLYNDCSPRKLYPRPLDYSTPARLYRYSDRHYYWEIEHWGTDDYDILEFHVINEGHNGFECWFHTDSPPFGFYKYLAEKFPDLRIYAESGFGTQCSSILSRFVADFDEQGKRRFQHMEWEEEYIEYYEEVPRDEELDYNVYKMLEKEEDADLQEDLNQLMDWDIWPDEPCMLSAWYPEFASEYELVTYGDWIQGRLTLEEMDEYFEEEKEWEECKDEIAFWTDSEPMRSIYSGEWISYDAWICSILREEEEYELYLLEEDYNDSCIYLDDRDQYDSDEEYFPSEEELIEDEIRMNHMDFDEWRDFMSRLGKNHADL